MKFKVSLFCLLLSSFIFGQNKELLNNDGTISNYAKRELFVININSQIKTTKFELDDKTLIVITSDNLTNEIIDNSKIQNTAFYYCLSQLKNQLHGFKNISTSMQEDGFEKVIFKTNVVFPLETRRYHFQFSINEIKNFPELIDIKEILDYLGVNNNKNIILVKNPN